MASIAFRAVNGSKLATSRHVSSTTCSETINAILRQPHAEHECRKHPSSAFSNKVPAVLVDDAPANKAKKGENAPIEGREKERLRSDDRSLSSAQDFVIDL